MDAALLSQIFDRSPAFKSKGKDFVSDDSVEVALHLARDGFEATVPRVRSVTVDGALTIVVSAAEGSTTTYLETASIVAVTVRGTVKGEKKRAGFA